MAAPSFRRSSVFCCCVALLASLGTALPTQSEKRQVAASPEAHDYIIVGGGTAGLALAARLTEDGTHSVLVLEAGSSPETVLSYQAPGSNQQVLGSAIDWGFGTMPQPGLNGRTLNYNQGRCLGGSSAINGLAYDRGSSSIYDLWASLGNMGWSWEEVLPFFKKSVTANPADGKFGTQTFNAELYSGGPVQLAYPPSYVPTLQGGEVFIDSLSAIGVDRVQELNGGNNLGVKQTPLTMDSQFHRSSSYDSFYMQAQGRPNLKVLEMSPVERVILEETGETVKATGVVYTDYASGQPLNATANKEVIVSAGVFKTPQLLMLSGIGPSEALAMAGIQEYVANENVGQNLQDHVYFSVIAEADASISASSLYQDYSKLQQASQQFQSSQGPLTAPIGVAFGFEQLSDDVLASIGASAITAEGRSNQAHVEYLYETNFYPNLPSPYYSSKEYNTSYVSLTAALVAPTSRGNVTVLSNSPADPPQIDPQYYATPEDEAVALHSFKNLRKALAKYAESGLTIGPNAGEVSPGAEIQSDEDIMNHIRETSIQLWHASGTCSMLPHEKGGVVGGDLKVYGVEGLRVVDASVFPVIPDTHIVAATYMLAEKAADMILNQGA